MLFFPLREQFHLNVTSYLGKNSIIYSDFTIPQNKIIAFHLGWPRCKLPFTSIHLPSLWSKSNTKTWKNDFLAIAFHFDSLLPLGYRQPIKIFFFFLLLHSNHCLLAPHCFRITRKQSTELLDVFAILLALTKISLKVIWLILSGKMYLEK